jgi:hypothetical protein
MERAKLHETLPALPRRQPAHPQPQRHAAKINVVLPPIGRTIAYKRVTDKKGKYLPVKPPVIQPQHSAATFFPRGTLSPDETQGTPGISADSVLLLLDKIGAETAAGVQAGKFGPFVALSTTTRGRDSLDGKALNTQAENTGFVPCLAHKKRST